MGSRVLVVDDDLLLAMCTVNILEGLGYQTCDAGSAVEALEMVRTDADIAMVLTDLHMPGLDGYQLAEQVRTIRPELPVVLVTGDELTPNDRLPVLYKPFTRQQVSTALQDAHPTLLQ